MHSKSNLFFFLSILLVLVAIYTLLYQAWYVNQATNRFEFFDDMRGWKGMDKLGHLYASFWEGYIILFLYAKIKHSKMDDHLWLCFSGFLIQFPIEIFDGFSLRYGFSIWDLSANLLGSLLLYAQLATWKEVRLKPKFWFMPTSYPSLRPDFFGNTLFQHILKDYNGQTYWYSLSPQIIIPKLAWPPWLLFSIGYGADGLLGGDDNIWSSGNQEINKSNIERISNVYVSFDIQLDAFAHKNLLFKRLATLVNCFKIPLSPSIDVLHTHFIWFF